MKKYRIDYGWSVAEFYTASPEDKVLGEFSECANNCFGIRKSITRNPKIVASHDADLPEKYLGKNVTHVLVHNYPFPDEIAFDATRTQGDNQFWKVRDEWGDECTCEGNEYSEHCGIHKYYLEVE